MKRHRFGSHTPEELRRGSNLGHRVEGLLLAAVGGLALLDNFGFATWASAAWPILILIAGLLLLVLLYPTHPLADWPAIWRDPQQRQHTIMAAAIALAGATELVRGSNPALAYVWPAALLIIGILFLTHAQHGTGEAVARAVRQHRVLGTTAIIAGLLRAAEFVTGTARFAVLWPLALLVAAAQLILYREPEGAFEPASNHGRHGEPG
jgi:hypothetical protein